MTRATLNAPVSFDFAVGDFVRRPGQRGTGMVESITGDHAVVAWSRYRKDILPLAALRPVHHHGERWDRRPEPPPFGQGRA